MGTNKRFRFFPVIIICLAFVLLSVALLGQQFYGRFTQKEQLVSILSDDSFQKSRETDPPNAECLVLLDSTDAASLLAEEDIHSLFEEISVEADYVDLSRQDVPFCGTYEKVIFALSDYGKLGNNAYEIMNWVNQGGNLMIYFPPQEDSYFRAFASQLGISELGWTSYEVKGITCKTQLMLGGYENTFKIVDSFHSSLALELSNNCTVHIVSADERELPILWEYSNGTGKIVFMNFGIMGKAYRGLYAAAYSLLGNSFAWPVINGSAFYLDDFPSPVPSGTSIYIERDYGLSVQDFYTNIWWPDLRNLAEKYGIRYSGMIIEDYSDIVNAPFPENLNTQRFRYFGSQLLKDGGELGLHGYNHLPLCTEDFSIGHAKGAYEDEYGYIYWESEQDMSASVEELISFTENLFPGIEPAVYVPPSNVLSEEGRELLARDFPQIRGIASSYFSDEFEYSQEFEVADDGIVEMPRIISGSILTPFMEFAAFSELNLHYVNSHFQHPDDVLDEDRGAESGWAVMKESFSKYLDWLYTAAPSIRNLTASEMAGAVQRYYYLDVDQMVTQEEIILDLDNFQDEAFLFLRINGRLPEDPETCISGGKLQDMGGGLYLVSASSSHVVIRRGTPETETDNTNH